MKLIDNENFQLSDTCVAFGTFDGIHSGHRSVIGRMKEQNGLTSAVITWEEDGPVLTTGKEKEYLLGQLGIDCMISVPSYSSEKAEDFVRTYVAGKAGAKVVVTGEGIRFGEDGDIALLRRLGDELGFSVISVPDVEIEGERVTKEAIVRFFEEGRFIQAVEYIGGPYVFAGPIVHGMEQGRKVGMPTANLLRAGKKILPPLGVYGSLSGIQGEMKKGVTNIGRRPSVDERDLITVETFLLDFEGDLYEQEQFLELHFFIRDIKKFSGGLNAVKEQVERDILQVRKFEFFTE